MMYEAKEQIFTLSAFFMSITGEKCQVYISDSQIILLQAWARSRVWNQADTKRNFNKKIGWQSWDSDEEVGSIRWKRWEYENEYQSSGLPNETTDATTPGDAFSIEC